MSFHTFCNICFMKQNIIKLCEEENEHIFNILITFTQCRDILNGIIYLCTNCCNKIEDYDKFKQLFLTNFVRFRYLYYEHRKMLEVHNEPDIEMRLKSFVDVNVERPNGTPLIENFEYIKNAVQSSTNNILTCKESDSEIFGMHRNKVVCSDTSFSVENNRSENETRNRNMNYECYTYNGDEKNIPGSTVIEKCEPSFHDEEYNEFTNTDIVPTSISYASSTYNESCNFASEGQYFETEDIKVEKGEPSFCNGDYQEFMKSNNVVTSILYSSSSSNLRAAQTNFETVDIKIEKDEPNPDQFEEVLHSRNMSNSVGSVIQGYKSGNLKDDSRSLLTNSKNGVTEDKTVKEGPSDEANKATKIRDICKVCNKGFRSKNYLEIHMRVHTGERPYACDECQKTFVNNSQLIAHRHTHSGEKPYKCDECDMSFFQFSHLNTHKRMHTGERPYSCDQCNKSFTCSRYLIAHKRKHSDEKPYKCDECGLRFMENRALNVHRYKHTGENPYQCDECDKTFAEKFKLMRHKRVHTGEKPYKCDECGIGFSEQSSLKRHKPLHTGEKPYSCDECHKTFAAIPTLITHKRVHTGEKPYKCDECGLGFTQQCNLKRHKRLHTVDKL